jgi:uncharacterized sulfatase
VAPPNIVWIIGDDQGWGDFGFMGHPSIETPHMDRLASGGAVFENGYVPSSLCRPSLASLITGLYGHQHRICCNDPPAGVDRSEMLRFIREVPTLPRLLSQSGYQSLQTGKWWEGHYREGGFTHGMTRNEVNGRHGDLGLRIGRDTMEPIYDFIREVESGPFFLWYAPFLPHTPHNPPERLREKYLQRTDQERLAHYWAMCEWFDETVGQLMDFLDQEGLLEKTLIMFAVDNGWIQNVDPPKQGVFNFAPKSKRSPYDGGVRTPIILSWPGHIEPQNYQELVSTLDFVPTVLDFVELPIPVNLEGTSLVPLLLGGSSLPRTAVFGEIFSHDAVRLEDPFSSLLFQWVRKDNWKLIRSLEGDLELYDLSQDPYETIDLSGSHPQQVRELEAMLYEAPPATAP